MNRRTFLTEFLKGSATILAAPTIVTHGLHLRKRLVEPVRFVVPKPMRINPNLIPFWYQTSRVSACWSEAYKQAFREVLKGNPDFTRELYGEWKEGERKS